MSSLEVCCVCWFHRSASIWVELISSLYLNPSSLPRSLISLLTELSHNIIIAFCISSTPLIPAKYSPGKPWWYLSLAGFAPALEQLNLAGERLPTMRTVPHQIIAVNHKEPFACLAGSPTSFPSPMNSSTLREDNFPSFVFFWNSTISLLVLRLNWWPQFQTRNQTWSQEKIHDFPHQINHPACLWTQTLSFLFCFKWWTAHAHFFSGLALAHLSPTYLGSSPLLDHLH